MTTETTNPLPAIRTFVRSVLERYKAGEYVEVARTVTPHCDVVTYAPKK